MFKELKGILKNRMFKGKKIKKSIRLFDKSELHDEVSLFLSESTYTIKDVLHINKKIREINKDKDDKIELKKFLDDNKNISNDKRLVELVLELCKILKNRKELIKSNLEKSERFVKFLAENAMNYIDDLCKVYEMIISLDNYDRRIEILDEYITNNKKAIDEINLLNEMELLLKKDIDLEELYRMNQLEIKMLEIEEKLNNEEGNFYSNKKKNSLRKKYDKLQKQTKQINKGLKLIKTA